jgi:isoquinoline 1-oxidoreductase beta subunit
MWTREDDTRCGYFRPASYHLMRAALDAPPPPWLVTAPVSAQRDEFLKWALPPGTPVLAAGDELGRFEFPAGYIPNLRLAASALRGCPVPLGQCHSVEDSSNVFVYQSFIDELAHLAGADPLSYRLALLGDVARCRITAAATTRSVCGGTGDGGARGAMGSPLRAGSGRGIAGSYANSAYVAIVAQVEGHPAHSCVCSAWCQLRISAPWSIPWARPARG